MATSLISITPECSICCESLKSPKVLQCGHTFCLDCIERYIGDKTQTFPCPICGQDIKIPEGGAKEFTTNFIIQTSHVTGTTSQPTSQVTDTTSPQISQVTDQLLSNVKHFCPNHNKKEVEFYCQNCNLGLCSKCIYRDHNDHQNLDLECDSTREMVVEELSKSEKLIKNKIKDLEKTHATLVETSEKLKTCCEEACTKVSEHTEKMIRELKENCEKTTKEIRYHFDRNESILTQTKQKVLTQIKNINTDLDTNSVSIREEPSLTLVYSLTKLKDLHKLCDNMNIDVPQVTYVEWKESNGKVCDILGSTETKILYQSSEGIVFKFNYKDIKNDEWYYSKEKYKSDDVVLSCSVMRDSSERCLYIDIDLPEEDNQLIKYCNIEYKVTFINKDKDKNVISETMTRRFKVSYLYRGWNSEITWNKLTDQSQGFIDNEGQFLVRFDILQVLDIKYK